MPQRFDLPALWYSVDGTAFGEGDLPHLGLAHQYLNHYRCRSEYEDLLSRTALPVGVRTGLVDAYGFRRSDGALSSAAGSGAEGQRPQRLVLSTSSGSRSRRVRWRSTGPICSSWKKPCAATP
jgi:hypothetical protein